MKVNKQIKTYKIIKEIKKPIKKQLFSYKFSFGSFRFVLCLIQTMGSFTDAWVNR
jgi:hypothetical protein